MRHWTLNSINGANVDSTTLQHVSAYGSTSEASGYGAPRKRPLGIVLGIAVSLLLHALLIYGYRSGHRNAAVVDDAKRLESLTVWIRPTPRVEPAPSPAAAATARTTPAPRQPLAPTRQRSAKAPPRDKEQPRETLSAPEASFVMTPNSPAPNPEPVTETRPKLDMEALRRSARHIAATPDPARAGMAVAQMPDKPLATETPLARGIQSATRANCKDGIPGGLLAPLVLLMDKKDSGCKW